MQEKLTVNSIALGIIVLKGEQGKDWEYESELTNSEWWIVVSWIRRN